MKTKSVAIILGIFLCGTAWAEWVPYGKNVDGGNMYYDADRISKMPNGNIIVWLKSRSTSYNLPNGMIKLWNQLVRKRFIPTTRNNIIRGLFSYDRKMDL